MPLAFFADRITTREQTGYSPYYLLYGREPLLPFDLVEATWMIDGFKPNMPHDDLLALRIRQLEKRREDLERAANKLALSRFKSKEHFMKEFGYKIHKEEYKPGDLVLVRNSSIEDSLNKKIQQRYFGPYMIFEGIGENQRHSYIVQELSRIVLKGLISANRLISYRPRAIFEDENI